jgi:hypothetical protein
VMACASDTFIAGQTAAQPARKPHPCRATGF